MYDNVQNLYEKTDFQMGVWMREWKDGWLKNREEGRIDEGDGRVESMTERNVFRSWKVWTADRPVQNQDFSSLKPCFSNS